MARNTALLERVMQHINDHPEQHKQNMWLDSCGTAGCFAGWACLLSRWENVGDYESVRRDEEVTAVDVVAIRLLGITDEEAIRLFNACNTRPILQLMVKDLVNGDELRARGDYGEYEPTS